MIAEQAVSGNPHPNVRFWLEADIPWGTPKSPLLPRKPTFEGQCPLSHRFRLLYLQEQTFLAVSPKVRS